MVGVGVYLQGTPALVFFFSASLLFFSQLAASGSWLRPPDANIFVTECQGRLDKMDELRFEIIV